MGSIGLNWYGYLMSRFYGLMLVIAFFIMLSSYDIINTLTTRKSRGVKGNRQLERAFFVVVQ